MPNLTQAVPQTRLINVATVLRLLVNCRISDMKFLENKLGTLPENFA